MNIAVINVKDLFKYILKFFGIIIIIILLTNGIKSIINIKQNTKIIGKELEENKNKLKENSFLGCLNLSISLMSYKKNEKASENLLTNNKIISMGVGILDEKILKNTDLIINEEDLSLSDVEELQNKIVEIPKEVTVENVSENNITPKVTDSYGSVKIDNQSDYNITEEMLVPDVEITNKKDILIYHTHTCESYTPSERL